jgi:hypothetical protein
LLPILANLAINSREKCQPLDEQQAGFQDLTKM